MFEICCHDDKDDRGPGCSMSLQMNGVEEKKMRYAELPGIFKDSAQVESDWYTLAV